MCICPLIAATSHHNDDKQVVGNYDDEIVISTTIAGNCNQYSTIFANRNALRQTIMEPKNQLFFFRPPAFFIGKPQLLVGTLPFFIGKPPFLIGKPPDINGIKAEPLPELNYTQLPTDPRTLIFGNNFDHNIDQLVFPEGSLAGG